MAKETIIKLNRTVFRKTKKYRAALFLILGLFTVIAVGITAASAAQMPLKTASHSESDKALHGSGISQDKIDTSIDKALSFLKEHQLPSGEFPMNGSLSPEMTNSAYELEVFGSTFVLHALGLVKPDPAVNEMKNKTGAFLLANKEDPGVWRYWGKYSNIPPDMDDTSTIVASLKENGIPVEESGMDYAFNYRAPDGVFYTFMNEEKWMNSSDIYYPYYKMNDIDPVVNANMAYALSLIGKPVPEVSVFLNGYIENKSFTERTIYYHIPYSQLYMFTRAYADGHVSDLKPSMPVVREYLLSMQKEDGSWGNELNTSLAAISLMNTGYKGKALDKAINHILKTQRDDGSWPERSFFVGIMTYWGSEEVSTAFSIEALSKYNKLTDENEESDGVNK